jgi:lipopolysaccharide biosynthesis regulator YciM
VKLRTFLMLLVASGLVFLLSVLYTPNREVLTQRIFLSRDVSLPVWAMFLLVALFAMAIPVIFGLLRDVKQLLDSVTKRRALKAQKEIEQRYLLGIEAILNGREERALEHFNAILQRDPAHFESLIKAGDVHRSLGRSAQAIELHRRARQVRENDLRPLFALVDDFEAAKETLLARATLSEIIERKPRRAITAYRRLRALLVREKEWEAALEIQTKIEELLGEAIRKDDRRYSPGISYQLACGHAAGERTKEALAILRRLVKEHPDFVPAAWKLGKVLVATGESEEAVAAWRKGFEATSAPIFLTAIEDHFLQMEEPERAIEVLKQLVWKAKRDVIPRFFLAKLYYRLEMLDEALDVFRSLRAKVSYAPTIPFYIAHILERRGDPLQAAREYSHLLSQLDPLRLEFHCTACNSRYSAWRDYCDTCGEWNSIQLDLKEQLTLEELGINPTLLYDRLESDEIA